MYVHGICVPNIPEHMIFGKIFSHDARRYTNGSMYALQTFTYSNIPFIAGDLIIIMSNFQIAFARVACSVV